MSNVIDEEECRLIDELKEITGYYKESVEKFKSTKAEKNNVKNNIDLLRLRLVENFENWFYKRYGIRVEEHELKLKKV
jgi:hypothetical protein